MRRRLGLAALAGAVAAAVSAGILPVWRWRARWDCHGSIWCCQYVDLPLCNGSKDPHWLGERIRRWRRRGLD